MVLHEIAGADADDPGSAHKGFAYVPQLDRPLSEITIGYAPVDFERVAPEARGAMAGALESVKALGVKLKEVEIPDFPYGALVTTVIGAEAASIFEDLIRSGKIDQLADRAQAASLKAAIDIPAVDYLKAQRVRSQIKQAFREMFSTVDLLLTPARMAPAPRIEDGVGGGGGAGVPGGRGLSGMIPAGNLAGLPALSLPCGLANGLPMAISLVGRPFYENQMIAVGRSFQAKTDWHRRKPPMVEQA